MSDAEPDVAETGIAGDYELDAPPHKVWRALHTPELRDIWLPGSALAHPEAISVTPGEELRYRLRDDAPPFLESTVTFRIAPNGSGGTRLWVIHALTDPRFDRMRRAASNTNGPPLMRAA
ncbi:SRPBCC domain-containing protein [Methylobacterium sp. J-048]|uniref:SRPBCC family protein n=1 Tax=Methylobacterium sp. J-048 TaxID=2836635 RepID=UPI001FB8A169|nr:SRPBCC domain-containing protein [Methylobacterium sp. J-048]MCJ2060999.1 SRPBCC domain-containing protein [Methylobacterium sp. J-048]